MKTKTLLLLLFAVLASMQWFVPAQMIFEKEKILAQGKEFKFKTAPVDPNDPFRGKFITLDFDANSLEIANDSDYNANETVFVILASNDNGFASIASISKKRPEGDADYVKARVQYVSRVNERKVYVEYPFRRFYMDESKADSAETVYHRSLRDTSSTTYALVLVREGNAVLKDVMIDGVSITKIARRNREN